MDELAGLEPRDLRDHHGQQRIRRDVEWDAEEHVPAALVELAAEAPVRDVELEEAMARRQCHFVDLGRVPRTHNMAPGVRPRLDALDDTGDLIDRAALPVRPAPPLRAVNRPEVAVFVGPLVPNLDAAFLQPPHVRVATEEPEQFTD